MIEAQFTPAVLALADGSLFHGVSVGAVGVSVGEVVFNTALTGYQEILTDPSYKQQLVTLTYPHIGNVGTNAEDAESTAVHAAGLIIREVPRTPSNWRNQQTLPAYLQAHHIVAIAGIDTRRLTRILREKGAQNGCIIAGDSEQLKTLNIFNQNIHNLNDSTPETLALAQARDFPGLNGADLAQIVTTDQNQTWTQNSWFESQPTSLDYHVVVVDFGVKHNILRCLVDAGCRLTIVPAQTQAAAILALQPDGVMLSNGPGDPAACTYAIQMARDLFAAKIPVFGICLGHQIMGLAAGAQTLKMKFGHHGANHPVQNIHTKQVMITSQNHGFAVDAASLPEAVEVSHISLFDGSLQGLRWKNLPAFSFQGHPEASPGPRDVAPLFAEFVTMMRAQRA